MNPVTIYLLSRPLQLSIHIFNIWHIFQWHSWEIYVHVCVIYGAISTSLYKEKCSHTVQTTFPDIPMYNWTNVVETLQIYVILVLISTKSKPTVASSSHFIAMCQKHICLHRLAGNMVCNIFGGHICGMQMCIYKTWCHHHETCHCHIGSICLNAK